MNILNLFYTLNFIINLKYLLNLKSQKPTLNITINIKQEAIIKANYKPGEEIFLALDVAASEFYDKNNNKRSIEIKL